MFLSDFNKHVKIFKMYFVLEDLVLETCCFCENFFLLIL